MNCHDSITCRIEGVGTNMYSKDNVNNSCNHFSADAIANKISGKLIVSVQAYPGEPMRHPETMAEIAEACEQGGAAAIRCQGLSDISAIKGRVEIPVFGIWKEGHEGVYITPTVRHALACVHAGADVIALDATARPRPDGSSLDECYQAIRSQTDALLMADCMTLEDMLHAYELGFDFISTTLSHNKAAIDTTKEEGPDLSLLRAARLRLPDARIICEGHVHTPEDTQAALEAGAFAVVVGTAITHPTSLTKWFCAALAK